MKSIIHIVGNRPQFIKLAVLHQELDRSGLFVQKIIHTGQHFSHNMSDLFFEELNIPPADVNLQINKLQGAEFIDKATGALAQCFTGAAESIAFVYGDTYTTLAGAIAAKQSNMLLVHFEAGVRTGDNTMPEEVNRVQADRLADLNLCCTARNYATMQAEGFGTTIKPAVQLTGDLMLDAFNKLKKDNKKIVAENNYVACTIHRAASINNSHHLQQIVAALNEINISLPVIVPLHPNTANMMEKFGCKPTFKILEPQGYNDMQSLLAGASFVITDSGGTCREAYFLKKTTLIIMEHPFWPEICDNNCALYCGPDKELIVKKFFSLPALKGNFETAVFGNGHAAGKIKDLLANL